MLVNHSRKLYSDEVFLCLMTTEWVSKGSDEPGIQFGRSTFRTIIRVRKGKILGEPMAKPACVAGFCLLGRKGGEKKSNNRTFLQSVRLVSQKSQLKREITMKASKSFLVFMSFALAVTLAFGQSPSRASASTTIVVNPAAMNGWAFQISGTATAQMVAGPASPPLGTGSAELAVGTDGDGGAQMRNANYTGTKLSDLTALSYSTYVSAFMGCQAPYIILNLDLDSDGTADDFLFFEPCYQTGSYSGDPVPNQGAPMLNTWQTWDAFAGGWWSVNAATFGPPLTTLATYIGAHPDATIVNTSSGLGGVRLVAGFGAGAWDNFVGNVDAFTIGVGSDVTTYDFETLFSACAANVDIPNTTITLLADCTTDETIFIPDGWTLDGDGYTITAVDPTGGHFLGAVVKNAGTSAYVTNLTVTTSNLANVCDPATPVDTRLRGILFDGAGGSITNNTVVDINQGASGCQEGNAIEVRNAPFDSTGTDLAVTISGNTVSNYQKNGITANGSVAASITDNVVTGAGPVNYIAQNGIQIGFGGTAFIQGNTVSGNDYTPADTVACGMLYFQADGVKASMNTRFGNERDQCNFGKGGGSFNPSP
jgi:hypothetical protein